jgi:hypothetical protein
LDGIPGRNGLDGIPGTPGLNGIPGISGTNGTDGKLLSLIIIKICLYMEVPLSNQMFLNARVVFHGLKMPSYYQFMYYNKKQIIAMKLFNNKAETAPRAI